MSRLNWAKWALPEVIDPPARRCIQVQVPDDPAHIAAFRGAMLMLQSAYNWADDPAHTARLVALVWRDIIDNMNTWGCDMGPQTILRADPDGCGVQWSLDDGLTWETIDLSTCITALAESSFNVMFPGAFSDALQQAIADGIVQQAGTQQGPQPALTPGGCQTFHVVMQAREQWISPVPVSAGMTVEVANASGGWNDGAVYWYCPDGNSYGIGICTPGTAHTEVTDPLNSVNHMTVIGKLMTAGTYFDPSSGPYTVPGGSVQQLFVLQANDQSLTDNYGEIQFDVTICYPSWCAHFDQTTGLGTWTAYYGGTWTGSIWQSTVIGANESVWPRLDFASTFIHTVRVVGYLAYNNNAPYAPVQMRPFGGPAQQDRYPLSGAFDDTFSIDAYCTGLSCGLLYLPVGAAGANWISDIYITGTGPNPFGLDNC